MTSNPKLSKVLEYLIKNDEDKAKELLHQVFIEKARAIHEEMMGHDDMEEDMIGGSGDMGKDFRHSVNARRKTRDQYADDINSDLKHMHDEIDFEETINEDSMMECEVNGRPVAIETIEVDSDTGSDEVYAAYAEFEDGQPLSMAELDRLTDKYADELMSMSRKKMFEGDDMELDIEDSDEDHDEDHDDDGDEDHEDHERIMNKMGDLQTALAELKSEFEKLEAQEHGDDEEEEADESWEMDDEFDDIAESLDLEVVVKDMEKTIPAKDVGAASSGMSDGNMARSPTPPTQTTRFGAKPVEIGAGPDHRGYDREPAPKSNMDAMKIADPDMGADNRRKTFEKGMSKMDKQGNKPDAALNKTAKEFGADTVGKMSPLSKGGDNLK